MTFSTLAIKNRLVRLRSQKEDQERRQMVTTVEKYWSGQSPYFSELNNNEMKLRQQFHLEQRTKYLEISLTKEV